MLSGMANSVDPGKTVTKKKKKKKKNIWDCQNLVLISSSLNSGILLYVLTSSNTWISYLFRYIDGIRGGSWGVCGRGGGDSVETPSPL